MKLSHWIMLFFAGAPLVAGAAGSSSDAKLIAVSGSVAFTGAHGEALDATPGTALPEGSIIVTSSGGEATVELFAGTITVVQPDTHVSIETRKTDGPGSKEYTILNLESGSVVNSLDPAKHDITDFRVRTPKGMTTAHGTVFAVKVTPDKPQGTVATMSGTVTFVTDQGEFTVSFGHMTTSDGVLSVADAVKANPSLANDILQATADVAKAIGSGAVTNTEGTPNLVTTVLAALIDVAVQAAPENAAETVRSTITAAAPALNSAQVKAVTVAAVQSTAKVNPTAIQAVAAAAKDAGKNAGGADNGPAETTIIPALDQTQIVVSPASSS